MSTHSSEDAHQQLDTPVSVLEPLKTPEEELKAHLCQMAGALSNPGAPKFKDFWESKKHCLELFKALSASRARSELWNEYTQLSSEAKRLKEIMDEQSSFAAEQIDLAIVSLEKDLENQETLLNQAPTIALLTASFSLKEHQESYSALQKELYLLSNIAARVSALRKELVKTEMRLGVKSKLFDRLSTCGDRVFPRRKELVKKVSDDFLRDIEAFSSLCMAQDFLRSQSLYDFREEVKVLQTLAKELTLNTESFSQTRVKLSLCWDKLKDEEKQKKKELDERRSASKQQRDEIEKLLQDLAQKVAEGSELIELENEILDKARPLARDDIRFVKEEIERIKAPLFEKAEKERLMRKEKQEAEENARREAIAALKKELSALAYSTEEAASSLEKLELLKAAAKKLVLTPGDKKNIEREFVAVQDAVAKRKQQKLLSAQDKAALDELYTLLGDRKARRQEIRAGVDAYRENLGSSGLDFEKPIFFQESLENEKLALTAMNSAIEELEEKIAELEE